MITPEKAREAIDIQIARNPAPARPAGRKAPTGRLSRWFNSTKSKLAKIIEKAWDYFNDAAVMSAGKGGWSPEDIRSAGMSGDLLGRAEALQARMEQEIQAEEAKKAAEQSRQQKEAKAEEAAEQARMLEEAERMEKPQEPDIWFFDDDDDDEPRGPSLG